MRYHVAQAIAFLDYLNAVLREMWRMVVADQLFSGNIRRSHLTKLTQKEVFVHQ